MINETDINLKNRKYPKGREITPENVREYEGFENVTDKEAEEIARFIRISCQVFFNIHFREVKQRYEAKEKKTENKSKEKQKDDFPKLKKVA